MPREMTANEVRDAFMGHVRSLIDYWSDLPDDACKDRDPKSWRVSGVVHSVLALLDGASVLPGFIVAPSPHPDDRQFHIDEGENWYPENRHADVKADIAGGVHELLYP